MSFLKNKNKTLLKQSKIITQQPKTKENPNIIDIKLVLVNYPRLLRHAKKTLPSKWYWQKFY